MNLVRRVFPRWPLIGLTLSAVLVIQTAAIADHLIKTYVDHVTEGSWSLTSARPIGGGNYQCTWTRSDDAVSEESYYPVNDPHRDAKGEDSPGHNASAQQTLSSTCSPYPGGGYFSLVQYHRYQENHTGNHNN